MAATIQHIEFPTKPRALDSSTSIQEVSQELIVNGAFTADANWSKGTSGSLWTISSGTASIDNEDEVTSGLAQAITLVVGATYLLKYDIPSYTSGTLQAQFGGNIIGSTAAAEDDITWYVTATESSTTLYLYAIGDSDLSVDNVSLKRVDTFSNNNHGKIYSGRALEFDGVSDHLTTGYGSGLNPYTTPITAAFWAKGINSNMSNDIVFGTNNGDPATQRMYVGIVNKKWDIGIQNSGWTGSNAITGFADQPDANVDTWYRVVLVMNAGEAFLYVNGVKSYGKTYTSYALASDITISGNNDTTYAWHGLISDVQFWDAAWSADDIAYDFANPESLALNASGTALTEGNLKVWYPMQDGHRGQQSYILDGANTGLNTSGAIIPNLSDNGDFSGSDDSNWHLDASAEWTVNTNTSTSFEATADSDISGNAGAYFYLSDENTGISANLPAGSYKLTGTLSTTSTLPSTQCKIRWFDTGGASQDTDLSEGDFEVITLVSSASGNSHFRFEASAEGQNFTLSNVKITPINDKHHATTVFYGDELITNGTFESNFTGWTNLGGSNMVRNTTSPITGSGDLHWGQSATDAGYTGFKHDAAITFVAGRTYRLTYTYKVVGTPDIFAKISSNATTAGNVLPGFTETALNATSNTDVSYTFTAGASGDYYFVFRTEENHAAEIFVDDISLKEVGVASGWTDADQQLDIAQPALQSYNEMLHSFDSSNAGFDAVTLVKVDDSAAVDIGTVDFSVSLWFKTDATYSNYTALIRKGGWGSDGYSIGFTNGNKLAMNIAKGAGYNDWGYTDTAIELGKWYHVVGVWDRSVGMKLHLNGVAQTMAGDHSRDTSSDNLDNTSDFNMYAAGAGAIAHFAGCINEVAFFRNRAIGAANVLQLYNDGKALDATLCDDAGYLKGYWRNNGLSTWENQILVPALSLTDNSTAILLDEALDDNEGGVDVDANHGFIVDDVIVVESEEMLIISVSTNTLTVVRGHNGTTAAAHDNDSAISVYKNGTVTGSETILIPQGVDGSRDAQGFIMNKQRNTSSLNLTNNTVRDYIDLGSTTTVVADGTTSLVMWLKPDDVADNVFLSSGGTDWLRIQDSNTLELRADGVSDDFTVQTIVIKEWVHVAFIKAGGDANEMSVYVNGELNGTASTDTETSNEPFDYRYIGSLGPNSGGFRGQIDGFLVYSDVLSGPEVLRNYKATKGSHRN